MLKSCVKVEVDVLGSHKATVPVDVKQHFNQHESVSERLVDFWLTD